MPQRVWSPTFVGREGELEALDAALERAAGGSPAFVFVAGESGVGKSRLMGELERHADDAGARVLVGHCLELGGAQIPYAPLVAALRPIAREAASPGSLALTPTSRSALAELLPELGDGAPATGGEPVDRGRLLEALLALLERLGDDAPVALVIEDLHWADPSTRDFLTYLVRSARGSRLLVVVTYRSDELYRRHPLRPLLAELERTPGVERLELERFTEDEAEAQLAGILEAPPDPALLARVYGRSQGNPLYTEELLAAADRGPGELPASLADALLMRVERLSPAAQEVVRVAAIVDRPMSHELLAEISGLDAATLLEGAREAIAHQVLVLDRGGRYAFRHALVGEAVYGDLLPGERAGLHDAAGEAIGRRPELLDDDVSELTVATEQACHFAAAQDQPKALAAAVRAALAAERVFAHSESLRHLDRALVLWDRVADADARAGVPRSELLLLASVAAVGAGEYGRAVAYARQGLGEVDADAFPARAAALFEQLGFALQSGGDDAAANVAWERGLALLPAHPPTIERVRLTEMQARNLMLRGRDGEAVTLAREAVAGARALGATIVESRALCALGPALATGGGDVDEAIGVLRSARELAARAGAITDESRALINLSDVLDHVGRTEEALRTVDEGLAATRERAAERSSYDAFLAVQGAWIAMRLGRYAEAETRLTEVTPATEGYSGIYLAAARAELALLRGRPAEAAPDLETVGRSGLVRTEPQWSAPFAVARAHLALLEGRIDAARAAIVAGMEEARSWAFTPRVPRLTWMGAHVEAEDAALPRSGGGDELRAAGYAAHADEVAARLPSYPEIGAYAVLAHAEVARLRRDPDAVARFAAAAEAFAALTLPWPAAYARIRAAEGLVAAGDREAAAEFLRSAYAWAVEAGAAPLATDAEMLARRARLALDVPPEAAPAAPLAPLGLTPREAEVLRLVADGRTNREIGSILYMSEKTASVHVSRILAKLGVRSRVEAAGVAHRLGVRAADPAR